MKTLLYSNIVADACPCPLHELMADAYPVWSGSCRKTMFLKHRATCGLFLSMIDEIVSDITLTM
jgi:hypothetical protein